MTSVRSPAATSSSTARGSKPGEDTITRCLPGPTSSTTNAPSSPVRSSLPSTVTVAPTIAASPPASTRPDRLSRTTAAFAASGEGSATFRLKA